MSVDWWLNNNWNGKTKVFEKICRNVTRSITKPYGQPWSCLCVSEQTINRLYYETACFFTSLHIYMNACVHISMHTCMYIHSLPCGCICSLWDQPRWLQTPLSIQTRRTGGRVTQRAVSADRRLVKLVTSVCDRFPSGQCGRLWFSVVAEVPLHTNCYIKACLIKPL
jgi:hypothetical protein